MEQIEPSRGVLAKGTLNAPLFERSSPHRPDPGRLTRWMPPGFAPSSFLPTTAEHELLVLADAIEIADKVDS